MKRIIEDVPDSLSTSAPAQPIHNPRHRPAPATGPEVNCATKPKCSFVGAGMPEPCPYPKFSQGVLRTWLARNAHLGTEAELMRKWKAKKEQKMQEWSSCRKNRIRRKMESMESSCRKNRIRRKIGESDYGGCCKHKTGACGDCKLEPSRASPNVTTHRRTTISFLSFLNNISIPVN